MFFFFLIMHIFKNEWPMSLFTCIYDLCLYRCSMVNSTERALISKSFEIDECNIRYGYDYNETKKCESWSFDRTFYGDTRATQVI